MVYQLNANKDGRISDWEVGSKTFGSWRYSGEGLCSILGVENVEELLKCIQIYSV